MRRQPLLAASLLLAFTAAACGSDRITGNADLAGTYHLETVNGQPLPFTVAVFGEDKLEVVSESITIADNGTFTQTGRLRLTESGRVTEEPYTDNGTYTSSGSTLTLRFSSDGSTSSATVTNENTLTISEGQFTAVYRRQS